MRYDLGYFDDETCRLEPNRATTHERLALRWPSAHPWRMTFQDLALEMDRWVDQFADPLVGLSRLPRPAHVPEDLETLRRLQIAHGQITTRHPKKESEALGNLHQQMILNPQGTGGYGAIAQRGADGRVRLTVLSPDGRSIAWQGVLPERVPAPRGGTRGSRQQRLEDGVREVVARATGQTFRPHGVYQRGSDLVPGRTLPRTAGRNRPMVGARRRRRPRRRRTAFDAFEFI
jgi:hypothetical protein